MALYREWISPSCLLQMNLKEPQRSITSRKQSPLSKTPKVYKCRSLYNEATQTEALGRRLYISSTMQPLRTLNSWLFLVRLQKKTWENYPPFKQMGPVVLYMQNYITCMWSPVKTTFVFGPAKISGVTASGSIAWAASSIRIWVKNPCRTCISRSTCDVLRVVITTRCSTRWSREGNTNIWSLIKQYFLAMLDVVSNLNEQAKLVIFFKTSFVSVQVEFVK